jgi:hypothetical protein
MFGGAEIAHQRSAESMAGETSQQPEARPERTETTEHRERNRTRTAESRATETPQQRYEASQQLRVSKICESEMASKDTHLVL